ncbi:MAG: hypothetical protein PF442_13335 [Desulfobulbaceae bacterium]|jgi:3-deoxy-D-manno-octulosonic-acid transferase|nr:hypothetical protein [Desulfobulbaceae bacterium]
MSKTSLCRATRTALIFYRALWAVMAPLLRFHKRMKIGYDQRLLHTPLPKVDLWIQAASVGEAYLVEEILITLAPHQKTALLITTNTSEGFNILDRLKSVSENISLTIRYCPFDRPKTMSKAIKMTQPKLMVLIESELWPGLLSGCKHMDVPVLVVNGRMTETSMNGYLRMPAIWQDIGPAHILAMSDADAKRFQAVFGDKRVETMFNIKFDRLLRMSTTPDQTMPLTELIAEETSFITLGSIREEEEEVVCHMIQSLLSARPDIVIGLFPRHMERITAWRQHLHGANITYQLRSKTSQAVAPNTVILWDTIGELSKGYQRAQAAFVGGSLAPLGGQNFLEPLSVGVRPVIGPSWSNFHWVGGEIFQQDMVMKVENWQEAVDRLLRELETERDTHETLNDFRAYARTRQGGCLVASDAITTYLK